MTAASRLLASALAAWCIGPTAVLAAVPHAGPSARSKPCYDTFDGNPFETVCYRVIANASLSAGLLTVREYEKGDADAYIVSYTAPASITTYQEALMLASFYLIDYFVNNSLSSSRTVPLTLRPPSPANDAWLASMALAPSKWPPTSKPPPPRYGTEVLPLGKVLVATLRTLFQESPQPEDFEALCVQLRAGVQKELPAWSVNETSPFTTTHARYNGELWTGPWEIECWVGVEKA